MSLDPQPAHSHLPKSTKVRSTCNACQQAKIRCSHEKPSCRRCQKHNIDCIYSMSRRLGRPAKRSESIPAGQARGKERPCRVQRRVKTGKRKTESASHAQRQNTESKDVSIEDELRTPMFGEESFSISDNIDFGSELWLQNFVSAQPSDVQDRNLFDSIDTSASTGLNFLPLESASETLDMNASCYFPTLPSNPEIPVDYLTIPPTTAPKPVLPEYPKRNTLLDSFPDSFTAEDQSHHHFPAEMSPSFSVGEPSIETLNQCECSEQAIRELSRVSNFSSHTAQSSIDTILICQRALQQLADTVLQCGTCSRSRVNLLMDHCQHRQPPLSS